MSGQIPLDDLFPELAGKTIARIRWMTPDEMEMFGWGGWRPGPILFFTDGSWLVPMSDEEGNTPGFMEYGGDSEDAA